MIETPEVVDSTPSDYSRQRHHAGRNRAANPPLALRAADDGKKWLVCSFYPVAAFLLDNIA